MENVYKNYSNEELYKVILDIRGYGEYWYLEKDVEKGNLEWIKD